MTAIEIIGNVLLDGVTLSINEAGKLRIEGDEEPIKKWLPNIRENKAAILEALLHRHDRIDNCPLPCQNCGRLEILEIMGELVPGCLYPITEGEWTEGWKRLPKNLKKCIHQQ